MYSVVKSIKADVLRFNPASGKVSVFMRALATASFNKGKVYTGFSLKKPIKKEKEKISHAKNLR